MAVEPPKGIRSHLQLAFGVSGSGEVNYELFEEGSSHQLWKPLLFSLCCFNALVHERQKFGTLGFNLAYDFTSSDLEVSMALLYKCFHVLRRMLLVFTCPSMTTFLFFVGIHIDDATNGRKAK